MSPLPPILDSIDAIRAAVSEARRAGRVVGLVPTMGALHAGHVRLIEAARDAAEFVVVSIFVNPTQFGPHEDFGRYPRMLDADQTRCAEGNASVIFAPSVEVIYPRGTTGTFVEVPGISHVLEGASRPGHFRGVATVVLKLFQIVGPDLAVFGEKDYQQLQVIRRMVADLDVAVKIRSVATVREPDGLAISSRNRYLNDDQRRAAAVLFRALASARDVVQRGERDARRVRQILRETLESQAGARIDYAEVADAETLEPLATLQPPRRAVALLAVRIGSTRLIDNIVLPGS